MLPSRGETEEVVRKHATSMQETLLVMRSLELAGDDESTELRAVTRSEEIAQRCRMHEVCMCGAGGGWAAEFETSFIYGYSVRP